MNFIIIGRTKILLETAEVLIKNGNKLVGVITAKEAPEYQKKIADFKLFAESNNCPFLLIKRKESFSEFLSGCKNPQIGISINFTFLIPQNIIDFFPNGILNAHGGDLPKYRGNACQAWAILNQENKIGLCIHKMSGDGVDSGNIISRTYKDINMNTRIGQIWEWMSEKIPPLFLDAVTKLNANKNYFLETQDETKSLRCFPRIPEDGKINWRNSASEILRLINASSEPYSGAFCFLNGKKIIVWRAELCKISFEILALHGQVIEIEKNNNSIIVNCKKGFLRLIIIELGEFKGAPTEIIKSIRTRLL